jgi:hypothetical protein
MSNAIALRETDTMAEWGVMREQALMLVKSKFLPKSIETPEQAVAIILTGRELGIGTMQALNNINVIQGKPTVPPQLMLALINRTKELEDMTITDDGQSCKVTMKRRGRQPHSESFSMKDATQMRTTEYIGGEKKNIALSEKYNWKQMPAIMRKWRAVAACARVVFPDVILGLYTPDEMGAAVEPESGEVWQAPPEVGPPVELREEVMEVINDALTVAAVRPVKLEGAQPTSATEWPKAKGMGAAIFAKCKALGFTPVDLANYIQMQFKLAVSEEPQSAIDALDTIQLKALDQALAGEFNNRGAK